MLEVEIELKTYLSLHSYQYSNNNKNLIPHLVHPLPLHTKNLYSNCFILSFYLNKQSYNIYDFRQHFLQLTFNNCAHNIVQSRIISMCPMRLATSAKVFLEVRTQYSHIFHLVGSSLSNSYRTFPRIMNKQHFYICQPYVQQWFVNCPQ